MHFIYVLSSNFQSIVNKISIAFFNEITIYLIYQIIVKQFHKIFMLVFLI